MVRSRWMTWDGHAQITSSMVGHPKMRSRTGLLTLDRMSENLNFPCDVRRVKVSLLHIILWSFHAGIEERHNFSEVSGNLAKVPCLVRMVAALGVCLTAALE